ncbi:hypothetical protein BDV93DRAFT_340379 [Ceratobasidium sp. AG-I]|nr:hypothetical protein BDV93DRAFT_340379 [Ceratobasidium sp. AG-I]
MFVGIPQHVYESLPESMQMPGVNHIHYQAPQRSYPVSAIAYVPTPTTARQNSLHTPPTVTTRSAYMSTLSSSYNGTPISMTPATAVMATPAMSVMITPASAILPVSPVNARFRLPMTHGPNSFGEGTGAGVRVPESEESRAMEGWKVEGSWGQRGSGMLGIETEEEEDARTEIGSLATSCPRFLMLSPLAKPPSTASKTSLSPTDPDDSRRSARPACVPFLHIPCTLLLESHRSLRATRVSPMVDSRPQLSAAMRCSSGRRRSAQRSVRTLL